MVTELPDAAAFVDAVSAELHRRLSPEKFETWFGNFKLLKLDDDEVEFGVPNGFVRDRINRQFSGSLDDVVTIAGDRPRKVRLTVVPFDAPASNGTVAATLASGTAGQGKATDNGSANGNVQASVHDVMDEVANAAAPPMSHATMSLAEPKSTSSAAYPEAGLNPDYVFDQFVVGSCNKLAHAAAMAIGANPGRAYNPFFVHGSVGLGKTHLLQAICHAVRRRNANMQVCYLSCEEFTNRFGQAAREKTLESFRAYHRQVDVLVVDDVEFLADKGRTQEEFFHTFNALYNQQKQIVLSSDRPPAEIPTLQERLVSRFRWGFVTDMQPPDFETRTAIVKRKASMRSLELDDSVAQYIAERFDTNIRELEGAVVKVIGTAAITDRDITIALAEEALQGLSLVRNSQVTLDDIMVLITSEFPISASDVLGRSRAQMVSLPRQIGMHLARQLTEHSLEEIGTFFGKRDHTTVLYAVGKINARIQNDRMFCNLIQDLNNRLTGSR